MTESNKKIKIYRGKTLNVSFDASRCSHGGNCIKTLPSVFNLKARPWINLDNCDNAELIKTVKHCPSGALQFHESTDTTVSLKVTKNGPLNLRGNLQIKAHFNDTGTSVERVSLCRCGHSKNMPYCDASHLKTFKDDGNFAKRSTAETQQEPAEAVDVICVENGPLMCKGNIAMQAANGETMTVINPALCRCGASKRKPFCDGSHNKIDFKTS